MASGEFVVNVVNIEALHPLPDAPTTMLGLYLWHGRAVPVLNLPGLLGGQPAPGTRPRLLLCRVASAQAPSAERGGLLTIGVPVDAVARISGTPTGTTLHAHDLPFADHSLDAVIAQAVLEHVADPWRCANEIHRVLKPGGLVYAETPFMQQVHGGRYDFTRFTALGHRRLFRQFDQIDAGSGGGPGTVLAWSYFYFLRSFARSKRGVDIAAAVARLTGFWLRYVDFFLVDRPAAQDGAWGYFFLGRRSDNVLSDRDLIAIYKDL